MTTRITETRPSTDADGFWASLRTINTERVGEWAKKEWHWLLVAAAYVLACWSPVRLCWDDNWNLRRPYQPLAFASFMPVCAALILWSRRPELRTAYRRSRSAPARFWTKGNDIPVVVGCLLLLYGSFVQVKGLSIFALVVIAVGVLYRIYGVLVLKAAFPAFIPLILMVPPPDSTIDGILQRILSASVLATGLVLNQIHQPATPMGPRLRLENSGTLIEFSKGCSAFTVALPAVVLLLCLLIARRTRLAPALSLLTVCGLISLIVSVVRILLIGFLTPTRPEFATFLNALSDWPFIVVTLGLTLLIGYAVERGNGKVPVQVQQMTVGLGRGAGALTNPLLRLLSGFGQVGKLWQRSERGLERLLKRLTPKRKKRRGGW